MREADQGPPLKIRVMHVLVERIGMERDLGLR